MADAIWPAGLPQSPLVAQYSQQDQDRTVRFKVDVGPDIVRRRATAAIQTVNIKLKLKGTQLATFQAFFRDTLAAGSLPFTWKHFQTGNVIDYRFTAQTPVEQPRAPRQSGTEYWDVTFQLETVPGTEVTSGGGGPVDPPPDDPGNPGGGDPGGGNPANAGYDPGDPSLTILFSTENDPNPDVPDDSASIAVPTMDVEDEFGFTQFVTEDAGAGFALDGSGYSFQQPFDPGNPA